MTTQSTESRIALLDPTVTEEDRKIANPTIYRDGRNEYRLELSVTAYRVKAAREMALVCAKAVCEWCEANGKPERDELGDWQHDDDGGCEATDIWRTLDDHDKAVKEGE